MAGNDLSKEIEDYFKAQGYTVDRNYLAVRHRRTWWMSIVRFLAVPVLVWLFQASLFRALLFTEKGIHNIPLWEKGGLLVLTAADKSKEKFTPWSEVSDFEVKGTPVSTWIEWTAGGKRHRFTFSDVLPGVTAFNATNLEHLKAVHWNSN